MPWAIVSIASGTAPPSSSTQRRTESAAPLRTMRPSTSTPLMRVCAVNGTSTAFGSCVALRGRTASRPSATIERPSGVSSARLDASAAVGELGSATPGTGMNAVAWRLPSVIVPVLSRSSVATSPAASTARPDIASTLRCTSRSMPGDADRGEQRADRRRDEAHEERDEHDDRLRGAGVVGERLQRHDRDQEDERQTGEQDVERDLVRCLLPRRRLRRARSSGRGRSRPAWP